MPAIWKRSLLPVYALATLAFGAAMEFAITGAVALFAHALGFWAGLAAFTATWLAAGLVVLAATVRFWPERATVATAEELTNHRILRHVIRLALRSRFLAALVVAWFFGPLTGPPFFRALGYQGRGLLLWVIASAPIFCAFWFGWTVGGFRLLSSLFHRFA